MPSFLAFVSRMKSLSRMWYDKMGDVGLLLSLLDSTAFVPFILASVSRMESRSHMWYDKIKDACESTLEFVKCTLTLA